MPVSNSILTAQQGTLIVNNATEQTLKFDGIFILEDTIFSSIKIEGIDIKDQLITNPAIAIKPGCLIRPKNGSFFSGIQLSSGSVALIL
jgi:hypothetical protein